MDESRAIATAISRCKMWCAGGGGVKPETKAKACAAVAEWEALKTKAHAAADPEQIAAITEVEAGWLERLHPRDKGGQFTDSPGGGGGKPDPNAWRTEENAGGGKWVQALGDLADKLDSDHPGRGLGLDVRNARDAVNNGDAATARKHLETAQGKLRDPSLYTGGRGDPAYLKAVGNSQVLGDHLKHLKAVNLKPRPTPSQLTDLARGFTGSAGVVVLIPEAAGKWDESKHPRSHGKFAHVPGGGGTSVPLEEHEKVKAALEKATAELEQHKAREALAEHQVHALEGVRKQLGETQAELSHELNAHANIVEEHARQEHKAKIKKIIARILALLSAGIMTYLSAKGFESGPLIEAVGAMAPIAAEYGIEKVIK